MSVFGILVAPLIAQWNRWLRSRHEEKHAPSSGCAACKQNLLFQWTLFTATLFMQFWGKPPTSTFVPPPRAAPPPSRPAKAKPPPDERGFYGPPLGEVFGAAKEEEERARIRR